MFANGANDQEWRFNLALLTIAWRHDEVFCAVMVSRLPLGVKVAAAFATGNPELVSRFHVPILATRPPFR